jgi:hypothetical protein
MQGHPQFKSHNHNLNPSEEVDTPQQIHENAYYQCLKSMYGYVQGCVCGSYHELMIMMNVIPAVYYSFNQPTKCNLRLTSKLLFVSCFLPCIHILLYINMAKVNKTYRNVESSSSNMPSANKVIDGLLTTRHNQTHLPSLQFNLPYCMTLLQTYLRRVRCVYPLHFTENFHLFVRF